ncbi:YtcA family lipoprotein [Beijerinckia mobilis]|uniref:YtcA family lipoprotein n=1 Tax=Beijerinckia mobilis TaxID=231434 RepID=UPI00068D629A|nr:YtcA family lipoprotein [Beijerinckia mobilis]
MQPLIDGTPASSCLPFQGKGQTGTNRLFGVAFCLFLLPGCTLDGAAAFEIAGAYFPGWMVCATLGILGGCLLRLLFIRLGIDERVPWKLFFYTAASLILTLVSWRQWFGPTA